MSTPGNGSNGNERRALLERRAAMVRERIEQRLEVLEHRRDGFVRRVQSFTKPPLALAIVAVVAVGVVGAALLIRRARRRHARLEWLGRSEPRRGWLARSFERAAVTLGAAALHRLGVWGLDNTLGPAQRAPMLPLPPRPNAPRLPRV